MVVELLFCKGSFFTLKEMNFQGNNAKNYWSTSNIFVDNKWTPTLLIDQTKFIKLRVILGILNDTNISAVLKLQALEVVSAVQKNIPKIPQIQKKSLHISNII